MNGLARGFHDWMASNGYGVYEGYTNGGHLRYRLSDGTAYIAGATPSKPSAVLNAKADVRRQLGLRSESVKAAHYSKQTRVPAFTTATRRTESGEAVDWLKAELDGVDAALFALNPRREPERARTLARRRIELAAMLRSMYQPVAGVGAR